VGKNPYLWGDPLTQGAPLRSGGGEDVEAPAAAGYRIRLQLTLGKGWASIDGPWEVLCLRAYGGVGVGYCPRLYEAQSDRV
jgi:hypothetical protein